MIVELNEREIAILKEAYDAVKAHTAEKRGVDYDEVDDTLGMAYNDNNYKSDAYKSLEADDDYSHNKKVQARVSSKFENYMPTAIRANGKTYKITPLSKAPLKRGYTSDEETWFKIECNDGKLPYFISCEGNAWSEDFHSDLWRPMMKITKNSYTEVKDYDGNPYRWDSLGTNAKEFRNLSAEETAKRIAKKLCQRTKEILEYKPPRRRW